jgi:hypothetical protein
VKIMSNTSYPSFGGTTLMATNWDAKRDTMSLSTNGVHQRSHQKRAHTTTPSCHRNLPWRTTYTEPPCQSFPGN